jgi:hypothetical protein
LRWDEFARRHFALEDPPAQFARRHFALAAWEQRPLDWVLRRRVIDDGSIAALRYLPSTKSVEAPQFWMAVF